MLVNQSNLRNNRSQYCKNKLTNYKEIHLNSKVEKKKLIQNLTLKFKNLNNCKIQSTKKIV